MTKDNAEVVLAELSLELEPELMAASQEMGKQRELEMVVAEILGELSDWV
jgi:hypothetical protein